MTDHVSSAGPSDYARACVGVAADGSSTVQMHTVVWGKNTKELPDNTHACIVNSETTDADARYVGVVHGIDLDDGKPISPGVCAVCVIGFAVVEAERPREWAAGEKLYARQGTQEFTHEAVGGVLIGYVVQSPPRTLDAHGKKYLDFIIARN